MTRANLKTTNTSSSANSKILNTYMRYLSNIKYTIIDIYKYSKKYKKAYSSKKKEEYLNKVENAYELFVEIYNKIFDTYESYQTQSIKKNGTLMTGSGLFRNSENKDWFKTIDKYIDSELNLLPQLKKIDKKKTLEYIYQMLKILRMFNDSIIRNMLDKLRIISWTPFRKAKLYKTPNSSRINTSLRATMHPSTKQSKSIQSFTPQKSIPSQSIQRFTPQKQSIQRFTPQQTRLLQSLTPMQKTIMQSIVREKQQKNTASMRSNAASIRASSTKSFCQQCTTQCNITKRQKLSPIPE